MIVCLISLCYLNNLLITSGKGLLVLEVRLLPTSDCLALSSLGLRADLSFSNSCLTSKTFGRFFVKSFI
jgi:hypothetical protein